MQAVIWETIICWTADCYLTLCVTWYELAWNTKFVQLTDLFGNPEHRLHYKAIPRDDEGPEGRSLVQAWQACAECIEPGPAHPDMQGIQQIAMTSGKCFWSLYLRVLASTKTLTAVIYKHLESESGRLWPVNRSWWAGGTVPSLSRGFSRPNSCIRTGTLLFIAATCPQRVVNLWSKAGL